MPNYNEIQLTDDSGNKYTLNIYPDNNHLVVDIVGILKLFLTKEELVQLIVELEIAEESFSGE